MTPVTAPAEDLPARDEPVSPSPAERGAERSFRTLRRLDGRAARRLKPRRPSQAHSESSSTLQLIGSSNGSISCCLTSCMSLPRASAGVGHMKHLPRELLSVSLDDHGKDFCRAGRHKRLLCRPVWTRMEIPQGRHCGSLRERGKPAGREWSTEADCALQHRHSRDARTDDRVLWGQCGRRATNAADCRDPQAAAAGAVRRRVSVLGVVPKVAAVALLSRPRAAAVARRTIGSGDARTTGNKTWSG